MEVTRALWKRVCLVAIAVVMAGTSLAFFVPARSTGALTDDEIKGCTGDAKLLAGSEWYGGNGVNVCSNGSSYGNTWGNNYVEHPSPTIGAVYSGYKWQCVELINRFYIKHGWISSRWRGNAYQMYDNAPASLAKSLQGSITHIDTGDVIVMTGGYGGFGHVGIVSGVADNGNGTWLVRTVNQNADGQVSFSTTYHVATKRLDPYFGSGFSVKGVVHRPGGPSGGESSTVENHYDAGPSAVLSGATLMVQHTSRSGDASTRIKTYGSSSYTEVPTNDTSNWATGGTSDIANDPTESNTAWVAAVQDAGEHGTMYLFKVTPSGSTKKARLDVNLGAESETDKWSLDAPPSVVVNSEGDVYIAAVQDDGDMSIFKYDEPTDTYERVSIGNSGAWSNEGTVSLAIGPDDAVWYAAVTKSPIDEVRTYKGRPGTAIFDYAGTLGSQADWTTKAAPAIVVDDDGDVTAVAVKNGGTMWSFHNVDGALEGWVTLSAPVGTDPDWSAEGSASLAVSKASGTSNDRVYVAGVRNANSNGGEMPIFMMKPDANVAGSTWSFDEMLGAVSDWSQYAAPDLAVASGGTVFLVVVNTDGYMHSYTRNPSNGDWNGYGLIGSNGWAGNKP
jgi:hypothetical protein